MDERKKLLATGNQSGFNMNDMEEHMPQLEVAYTDSEEDYAEEEEEEYEELIDKVHTGQQGDSISQLDGAADPVSCNLCDRFFEGKSKGINLISHKINVHFKDDFRRVVKDNSKLDGFFHCIEENCTAKYRQKADLFKHLATVHNYIKKFSNMAAGTCSLSVPASIAPNPGHKNVSDLQSRAETEHTSTITCGFAGIGRSTEETNQGIKLTEFSSYTYVYLFRV